MSNIEIPEKIEKVKAAGIDPELLTNAEAILINHAADETRLEEVMAVIASYRSDGPIVRGIGDWFRDRIYRGGRLIEDALSFTRTLRVGLGAGFLFYWFAPIVLTWLAVFGVIGVDKLPALTVFLKTILDHLAWPTVAALFSLDFVRALKGGSSGWFGSAGLPMQPRPIQSEVIR